MWRTQKDISSGFVRNMAAGHLESVLNAQCRSAVGRSGVNNRPSRARTLPRERGEVRPPHTRPSVRGGSTKTLSRHRLLRPVRAVSDVMGPRGRMAPLKP